MTTRAGEAPRPGQRDLTRFAAAQLYIAAAHDLLVGADPDRVQIADQPCSATGR